jgi:hypothetical protein
MNASTSPRSGLLSRLAVAATRLPAYLLESRPCGNRGLVQRRLPGLANGSALIRRNVLLREAFLRGGGAPLPLWRLVRLPDHVAATNRISDLGECFWVRPPGDTSVMTLSGRPATPSKKASASRILPHHLQPNPPHLASKVPGW